MKLLQPFFNKTTVFLKAEKTKLWLKVLFILAVVLGCRQALATDLLENTTSDMEDTLTGTGRKWLILIDFALAAALYIKTKNVMLFLGVLVISIAITSILPAFM
ncbi:MAG: hypothetical protein LRY67_07240 [Gammaproteobacteria bacterium]|nr:hypothetical protein [Gammaproteobacteria bacterium]